MNKVHPLFDLLFKKFFAILKYLIFSNKFWSHLDKFLQNTTEIFLWKLHYSHVLLDGGLCSEKRVTR